MSDFSQLSDDELKTLYAQMRGPGSSMNAALKEAASQRSWQQHSEYDPPSYPFQAKYGPTSGMSDLSLFNAGMGRGIENVGRHTGNLVGLESDQAIKDASDIDKPLMNTPAGRWGSAAGETAILTPAMLGGEAALGTTGIGANILSKPILRGALEGGAQGFVMGDPKERLANAVLGAGVGSAIPATLSLGKKLAYGVTRTPEAQQLLDEGVRLTPGQMNPEGTLNKLEENIRGIPKLGNIVENARQRAQEDFQRGVIENAAAPGYHLQTPGNDVNALFQEAQDSYKPYYDAARGYPAVPAIVNQGANEPLAQALDKAASAKTIGATKITREQAADFLDGQLEAFSDKAKASGGWMSDHLIDLRSRINEEIRGVGQDQAGKSYAALLKGARDKVTDAINSQLPADAAQSLQLANDAYPKLAIIRDAIRRGGDQAQGFTPAQLSQAVREAADNNQYARGGGLMRDWSSAGREIFTERNPKTGATHGTTATLGGLAYALHHFAPGAQIPAAVGALGGLGLVGTDLGRNLASGQTGGQQATQRLIEALRSATTSRAGALTDQAALGIAGRAALNRAVPAYLQGRSSPSGSYTGTP